MAPPQANADSDPRPLAEVLSGHGFELPEPQVAQLDRYRELLWSWNEKLNLTRHTTIEKFVARDVVDSNELAKLLTRRERVLDVGTGGGVPGVVLTILRPDLRVSLCESTGKKARAVEAIVQELGFKTPVFHTRAEEVLQVRTFDTLVVRAVAPLAKLLKWLEGSWGAFDQLLVIKGRSWANERGEARHLGLMRTLDLRVAAKYETPDTGAENVILRVVPKGELDLDK